MALATLKIRRFKNLEILHSAKQTLLFLLVNSGVDLGGNDTLLATSREASDLGIKGSFSKSESNFRINMFFGLVAIEVQTHQNISFLLDGALDLITDSVLGALEVVPGVTVVVHEGEEVVIQPDQLEVLALHIGNFHVVCGGTDILKLLTCKKH